MVKLRVEDKNLKVCPNNLTSNQLRNGCNGCAAGFNFNIASGQCEDFNECTNLLHVCTGNNKVCQNTVGSYKCLCIDGWILDLLPPDVASAEHNAACRYNFFGNNSPTCRRNEIALIPKLDREYLISFDIGPYWFKTNISLIHFTDCYSIDGCNPILHVYIALNGKIRVLNKHESYEGGAINETVLTSIEISQVLNNSDNFYKYTIKLNKEIVTSKLKKDVQSYKDVKVYASCFKDLLSNFNLINGIKSNGILPVVIIPTDLNLEKVWIHANRFMKTQYSHNQINGNANINNETLGIWVLKEHMLVIFRQFEYYGGFINVSVKTYTSQSAFWDVFIINNFGGFVRKIPFNTTHNGFFTCDIVLEYDEIKNSKFNKEIKEDLRCDTYLKEVRKNDSYLLELLDNDLLIGFYINFDYQSKWKNIESSMYLFSVNVSLDGLKRCPNGWVLNTHGNGCVDYDECKSLNPPCSWKSSVCINTNGSYKCSCKEGWFLDGESCLDFDECKSLNPPCSWKNSVCINTNGGHNCSCKEGWFLDGESCLDYDECKSSKPPCSWINSECINTNGGYNCSCKEGWFLDGESCLDFDECKSLNPPCSWKNSVCINTNGKYNCSCKEGWFLNGESCLDYDECKRFNPPCSWKNSVCVNTNGSYICSCKEGWFLDGESCLDLQTVNIYIVVVDNFIAYVFPGSRVSSSAGVKPGYLIEHAINNIVHDIFKAFDKKNIPLKRPDLYIGNSKIIRESSSKFLGGILDENLLWRERIKTLEVKISINCYISLYIAMQIVHGAALIFSFDYKLVTDVNILVKSAFTLYIVQTKFMFTF
ncbi:uncharacterized protein LOC136079122 [Hydra vulgaris]|uniref:Uncharacterized protein LOC136079122 n=1 Tax=Hydra vulgaris TaxID=6087 RepID=A0ABM4BP74_HYDVU